METHPERKPIRWSVWTGMEYKFLACRSITAIVLVLLIVKSHGVVSFGLRVFGIIKGNSLHSILIIGGSYFAGRILVEELLATKSYADLDEAVFFRIGSVAYNICRLFVLRTLAVGWHKPSFKNNRNIEML